MRALPVRKPTSKLTNLKAHGVVLGLLVAVAFALPCSISASDSSIGRKVSPFKLKDYRGKDHSLADLLRDNKAVAVIFLGTECPLAKLYCPRMEQLGKEFESKGASLIAIDSNRQDAVTEMDGFARQGRLTFPFLKDLGNKVADNFGATRTPEAFVIDHQGVIRYQGRIDHQYTFGTGVGYGQPQLKRRDLAIAVDEVVAGKPVSVARTDVKGCLIGRVRKPKKQAAVTYSNQISRLLNQRCVYCHRPGEIGPFAMTKYDEVAGWGEMIAEVIREQRMPPWHANPRYGKFSNENVLSEKEKELINSWVDAGCPEGNPAELPPAPKFTEGWRLERVPDKVVYMTDKPVEVKAEGVEAYRYYTADPGLKVDTWVRSAQCLPGNPSVVHHILVFVVPPGSNSGPNLLCVYAPGTRPFVAPPGMAKMVPAGWKLVFQVHYTPNGSPQKDRSAIGILFEDAAKVTYRLVTANTQNSEFEIPAYADDYKVESRTKFAHDTLFIGMFPHMHVRGQSFRYEMTYPNGKKEILLDVPHYDFNWQNWFNLAKPLIIPAATEMLCTAHFNNSENNPFNPDPSKPVRWGCQTWEEMMLGFYDVAFPKAETEKLLNEQHEADVKAIEAQRIRER